MAMDNLQRFKSQGKGEASHTFVLLMAIIDTANMIPPECELPDLSEGIEEVLNKAPDSEQDVLEVLNYCLKGLPEDFRKYILREDLQESIVEKVRRYSHFQTKRETLRLIARMAKREPHQRKLLYYSADLLSDLPSFIKIDEQGKLRVVLDPFAWAIEGVEAARIRECEVCQRIFWAGRLDQRCCTKQCARVLRTRRWREKYQTNYKLQRNGYKPLSNSRVEKTASQTRRSKAPKTTKGE